MLHSADGRVGATTRRLVTIDATFCDSWQAQPPTTKTGYPPDFLRSAPRTILPPLPLVRPCIFQSALSPRQSHMLRSEHPQDFPAKRPEAVTGGVFKGNLRQGRGWLLARARA